VHIERFRNLNLDYKNVELFISRKARESIKEFVGVAGKSKEEWQGKMDKWQRRSVAAHQNGKLLGKVDARRQSNQHRVRFVRFSNHSFIHTLQIFI